MTFDAPIDFDEAITKLAEKRLLPTELSSRQMQLHASDALRERAFFSARVTNAHILQGFRDGAARIVAGTDNQATIRAELKQLLASLSYAPEAGKEGSIEDLSSSARLNLMLGTNVSMVRGFGQWQQGNQEGALEAFPAQELIRVADRKEPREWFELWDEAAAELGDGTSATDADETGRMVALKNDPIWLAISDFGLPYPPFKFNSGMGVEDVSYEEAVDLGVMEADDDPPPAPERGMNDGLESSVEELDDDFARVLMEGLSGAARLVDGVLRLGNSAVSNRQARQLRDRGAAVLAGLRRAMEEAA